MVQTLFQRGTFGSTSTGQRYDLALRVISARLAAPLLNARRDQVPADVYDPDPVRYEAANALARDARNGGAMRRDISAQHH